MMPNRIALALMLTLLASVALAAPTQPPAAKRITLGKVTAVWNNILFDGSDLLMSDGATITGANYDLTALRIKAFSLLTRGGVTKIVADGDLARGTQAIGHFNSVDQGRYYTVYADHAVYVPDNSRPDGGTVDLTGHPKVITRIPGALAEPSTTNFDTPVHILLGQGAEYPKVGSGPGHTDFVPLR